MTTSQRKWLTLIISAYVSLSVADLLDIFNAEKNSKKEIKVYLVVLLSWASVIIFTVASLWIISFNSTIYDVTAQVESLEVKPFNNQAKPDWYLSDVEIHQEGLKKRTHTGTLFLAPESSFSITRIDSGNITVNIIHPDASTSAFLDVNEEYELALEGHVSIVITIDNNQSLVLPIEGEIYIGQMIKHGAVLNPILLSGEVSIIDKTAFTGDFYSVGPTELKPGDSFNVSGLSTQNSGFIHINDQKGFLISYRAKGDEAHIFRYKSEPILVKNGIFTKIFHDQTLILFWFFILLGFKITQHLLKAMLDSKIKK